MILSGEKTRPVMTGRSRKEEAMAKILVVDDELEVCDLFEDFFTQRGFEVITAKGGQEALAKVKEERPHVMLLDIRMPGMNGMEVLRRVKKIDKEVGIIVVTAVKEEEIGKRALKMGADDYITKPIDFDYLEMSVLVKVLMMTS